MAQTSELRHQLIDEVIEQIKKDISSGLYEGLEELLHYGCDDRQMVYLLPEDQQSKYEPLTGKL